MDVILKVVVVDDETPICDYLVYTIEHHMTQAEVRSSMNGEDAYRLILEFKPDIVLTDIRMPGMDGITLIREVLKVLPYTYFAILTSHAEFSYAQEAVALGARQYLLKTELRSKDILELLRAAYERKIAVLSSKRDEVLSSGMIDLFNLYQHEGDAEFAIEFWERQGMREGVTYQLLSAPADTWKTLEGDVAWMLQEADDTDGLAEFCGGLQGEPADGMKGCAVSGGRRQGAFSDGGADFSFTAGASEKEFQYIIVQKEEGLTPYVERLSRLASGTTHVGVGAVFTSLADFPAAMRTASDALGMEFFGEAGPVLRYDRIAAERAGRVDHDCIYAMKKELFELLHLRRCTEAETALDVWFSYLERAHPDELRWAKERCLRMVLSMEERLYQEVGEETPGEAAFPSAEACRAYCRSLLLRMGREYAGRHSGPVAEALNYIHVHYAEALSLAEVAGAVHQSPEYFSRRFKEDVGENYNVYLTLYRLDRAQELLRNTDKTVAQIAEEVGYTSAGYFSKSYRRYKGNSPEAERRGMRR